VRRRQNPLLGGFAFITLVFACLTGSGWAEDAPPFYAVKLVATKPAPDFTLTDQNGQPFSFSSLRGRLVLLSFGFTHCPNICPTTLAHLANIYKSLSPADQKQVQVLFVSIDPQRDTPVVLKDYVKFFDPHIIGVTGREDQVNKVSKLYAVEADEYNTGHTTGTFLVSRGGICMGYYRENQLGNTTRIISDLRRFMALPKDRETDWQPERVRTVKASNFSGRELYLANCASCHQDDGHGVAGKYPSLIDSPWVLGAPNRLVALTLDGVSGGHHEARGSYEGVMPAYRTILTPTLISSVLTYVRQSWGNRAPSISAGYVQKLISASPPRTSFWSWQALEALTADEADKAVEEGDPSGEANESVHPDS
jgi:protein SCO1/2